MTSVQGRQPHFSDFIVTGKRKNPWNVGLLSGAYELISFKLDMIVTKRLNSLVPFSVTLTITDNRSGMK